MNTAEANRQRAIRDARTPEWEADERAFMDTVAERLEAAMSATPTIKRATLFDGVIDSFRTETELNGWKVTQGALLL